MKKTLSLILALTMVLVLLGSTVFAATLSPDTPPESPDGGTSPKTEVNVYSYDAATGALMIVLGVGLFAWIGKKCFD